MALSRRRPMVVSYGSRGAVAAVGWLVVLIGIFFCRTTVAEGGSISEPFGSGSVPSIRSRRQWIHFGRMDEIRPVSIRTTTITTASPSSIVGLATRSRRMQQQQHNEDNEEFENDYMRTKNSNSKDSNEMETTTNNKFWPPWPFNLIGRKSDPTSTGSLFWEYCKVKSRIGLRQLQRLAGELWYHMPPSTPPLIVLALLPVRRKILPPPASAAAAAGETAAAVVQQQQSRLPSLLTNAFVRNLILASLAASVISWAHAELDRKRLLVPLPLQEQYLDIDKAFLPPFLPEEVPLLVEEEVVKQQEKAILESNINNNDNKEGGVEEAVEDSVILSELPSRLKKQLQHFYDSAAKPNNTFASTLQEWRQARRSRKLNAKRAKRATIRDELVALQTLKTQAATKRSRNNNNNNNNKTYGSKLKSIIAGAGVGAKDGAALGEADVVKSPPLGYALVTGASRGIGRALAVELARWNIPLVLVARDTDRLLSLATDLEQCYGVKCCVLPADLSQPGVAERIHEATTRAGLRVDVLVNNAGLSASGDLVEADGSIIDNILQVNAVSLTTLSRLYGLDMKQQRRGRILIVSSIMGDTYGGPTVAAYAATKAYEKTLAVSMAKELEIHGVGVTCLMPGAVGDSSFRDRSGSDQALCWRVPFYPRTSASVAEQGVRAMLSGDQEVIPGWMNRVFLKVVKPMVPQRFITLIVESFWNPPGYSLSKLRWRSKLKATADTSPPVESLNGEVKGFPWSASGSGASSQVPPRLLSLPTPPTQQKVQTLVESECSGKDEIELTPNEELDRENPGAKETADVFDKPGDVVGVVVGSEEEALVSETVWTSDDMSQKAKSEEANTESSADDTVAAEKDTTYNAIPFIRETPSILEDFGLNQ